jgi:hypothetical protein
MTNNFDCYEFDLIIHNRIHSIEANINTLSFTLDHQKPNGFICIEDIAERSIVAWELIGRSLAEKSICMIV